MWDVDDITYVVPDLFFCALFLLIFSFSMFLLLSNYDLQTGHFPCLL